MRVLRFNVFGTFVSIERTPDGWRAWLLGADGKRRPADFVVPDHIPEEGLGQYLADLFHEAATPTNGQVKQLR